jgi:hypothetical protein
MPPLIRRCDIRRAIILTIRVEHPETEHTLNLSKLQSWLDGGGKTLNEHVHEIETERDFAEVNS